MKKNEIVACRFLSKEFKASFVIVMFLVQTLICTINNNIFLACTGAIVDKIGYVHIEKGLPL